MVFLPKVKSFSSRRSIVVYDGPSPVRATYAPGGEKPALKSVLERYRSGAAAAPVQWATQQSFSPSYCPNCQRF